MEQTPRSVLDLPFSERRYIAVLSDNDFDRIKEKLPNNPYTDFLSEVIPLVVPGGVIIRVIARVGMHWLNRRPTQGTDEVTGRGCIKAIPLREASRFLFLGGCAEVGKAYAANPLQDGIYYSVETYNDDMIDHKLSELERILNGLGAKSYHIVFNSDEHLDGNVGIGAKRGVRAEAAIQLRNARAKRYERNGTSLGREPVLPDGLMWLDREPSWQALVESRLEHGRQEFGLRVNLERELQISSKINADFEILGLDVGADYKKRINFSLAVKGTFA